MEDKFSEVELLVYGVLGSSPNQSSPKLGHKEGPGGTRPFAAWAPIAGAEAAPSPWSSLAPQYRMRSTRSRAAIANDLTMVVYLIGKGVVSAQGTEVPHRAPLPQEGMGVARSRVAIANDLPMVVDVVGIAVASAQGAEVPHLAVLPHEGMQCPRRRRPLANDLPML